MVVVPLVSRPVVVRLVTPPVGSAGSSPVLVLEVPMPVVPEVPDTPEVLVAVVLVGVSVVGSPVLVSGVVVGPTEVAALPVVSVVVAVPLSPQAVRAVRSRSEGRESE